MSYNVTQAKRLAEKKCILCGKQDERILAGHVYCEPCAKIKAKYSADRRKHFIEQKLCSKCGKPVLGKNTLCNDCRIKKSNYDYKRKERK